SITRRALEQGSGFAEAPLTATQLSQPNDAVRSPPATRRRDLIGRCKQLSLGRGPVTTPDEDGCIVGPANREHGAIVATQGERFDLGTPLGSTFVVADPFAG